jgi:hypothetical protein
MLNALFGFFFAINPFNKDNETHNFFIIGICHIVCD